MTIKPTEIDEEGNMCWKVNGKFHREDGPAIVYKNGTEKWFKNGQLHRDGDLPAVIYSTGTKEWHQNGIFHRQNGPAFVSDNGYEEWWFEGVKYSKEEFNKISLESELQNELSVNNVSRKKIKI